MSLEESVHQEYHPTFSEHEKCLLEEYHIPPEFANLLVGRSSVEDIHGLFHARIPTKKPLILGGRAGRDLRRITPEDIQRYDRRFSASDLFPLLSYHIEPDQAVTYNPRFTGSDIAHFITAGVSPQDSSNYHPRFDGSSIVDLVQHHIAPETAERYNTRFDGHEILNFTRCGIIPELTERYNPTLNGNNICVLHLFNFSPEAVKQGDEELLIHMAKTVMYLIYEYEDVFFDRFNFLTTGNQSYLVCIRGESGYGAWKFSRTAEYEKGLFHILRECHGKTSWVVNVLEHGTQYAIELEYLEGETLESKTAKGIIAPSEAIWYGNGIFLGLQELRQAGIYHHRDIRPANIMIGEKHNRAVIIDLGIATTDKDALAKDNRRFGSPTGRAANDLNSLGQVMYKMATGEHIFAESKSMERTTYADQLRDQRDWIYEDEAERLPPYLRMVEERVPHPVLQDIIQFCLKSHGPGDDYQTLEQRFRNVA